MYIEYKIIKEIQSNPSKYLERQTLKSLYTFLYGYRMCIHNNNILTTEQHSKISDESTNFEKFLYDKFGKSVAGAMAFTTIFEYYHPNQDEAFNDVFIFHDEYSKLSAEKFEVDLEKYREIFEKARNEKNSKDILSNYFKIFNEIRKMPGLYIGGYTLDNLKDFLKGYILCMNELSQSEINPLSGFNEFVRQKYDIEQEKDVFKTINSLSDNEKIALDNFFQLFDEFLKR